MGSSVSKGVRRGQEGDAEDRQQNAGRGGARLKGENEKSES